MSTAETKTSNETQGFTKLKGQELTDLFVPKHQQDKPKVSPVGQIPTPSSQPTAEEPVVEKSKK